MSVHFNSREGYGVNIHDIEFDEEKFAAFIRKYLADVIPDFGITDNTPTSQLCEIIKYDYYSNYNGEAGGGAAIADAMRADTKIDFECCASDIDDTIAVIIPCALPWQFNDKEINLTVEGIQQIFCKYFAEITNDTIVCDQLSVEYFN